MKTIKPNQPKRKEDHDYTLTSELHLLIGLDHLAIIDTKERTFRDIPTEFQVISSVYSSREGDDDVLLLSVGSYDLPGQSISYNLRTNQYEVLMKSSSVEVPKGWISKPESLTFKTTGDLCK